MSAAVVRVDAVASSTGARALLKSFAVVDAVAAARALVELRGTVCGRTARRGCSAIGWAPAPAGDRARAHSSQQGRAQWIESVRPCLLAGAPARPK